MDYSKALHIFIFLWYFINSIVLYDILNIKEENCEDAPSFHILLKMLRTVYYDTGHRP